MRRAASAFFGALCLNHRARESRYNDVGPRKILHLRRREALSGKTVVDVTNALDGSMNLAVGFTTSGSEELQKKLPKARVVKAFNTVFAQHMDTGRLGDKPLTAFVAGDDASAKATVLGLAREIGFDAVDAGPLKNARLLEPLAYLNIQLGYGLGLGTQIGFKLLHG